MASFLATWWQNSNGPLGFRSLAGIPKREYNYNIISVRHFMNVECSSKIYARLDCVDHHTKKLPLCGNAVMAVMLKNHAHVALGKRSPYKHVPLPADVSWTWYIPWLSSLSWKHIYCFHIPLIRYLHPEANIHSHWSWNIDTLQTEVLHYV